MLRHLDKIFPCVGIAAAFPQDGGNVVRNVTGEAMEAVTLDEGHHVVFQRKKIIFAHTLKGSFSQMGAGWRGDCGKFQFSAADGC